MPASSILVGRHGRRGAEDEILGKPQDPDDSRRMLRLLSGGAHDVHTAVVVRLAAIERSDLVTTRVWFRGDG